jgi:hypothetical protein
MIMIMTQANLDKTLTLKLTLEMWKTQANSDKIWQVSDSAKQISAGYQTPLN